MHVHVVINIVTISYQTRSVFNSNSTPTYNEVNGLIMNLTEATSTNTAQNTTHFPQDLNTTNFVVTMVLDYLNESLSANRSAEPLPFNEVKFMQIIKRWSEDSKRVFRG